MQENQDIYLSILDQIDDVFYRTDTEGRLIMSSSSSAGVLGYDSVDEILGMPFDSWCCSPEDHARFHEEMRKSGGISHIEIKLRRKDGNYIYTEGSCRPYYDKDGNMLGFEGVWRDITKRKLAEIALRESESKYRGIFESTGNLYFLADAHTRQLIDVNEAACRKYGYTREEMLGLDYTLLSAEPEKTINVVADRIELVPNRYHRRKNGEIFPVETHISYYNWDGRDVALASVRDISEHLESEQAIRASEHKYRTIFEATGSPYLVTDKVSGRLLDVNEAACREYGYSRDEMLALRHVDLSAQPEQTLKAIEDGTTRISLRYHKRKNGEIFPVEIINSFCEWQDGEIVLSSIRDVTQRVEREKALRESEERYRGIVESQKDIVLRFGMDYRPTFASDSWLRITGVPIDKPGIDLRQEAIHPDDHKELDKHNAAIMNPPYRDYAELRIRTAEGWRWFGFESYLIRDAQDTPIEGQSVARDIHDKKVAEEALQTHARRLALATEAAHEGVWEHNLTTNSVYLSEQTYALLGYSPEEYGTVTSNNTVHWDDYKMIALHIEAYLRGRTDRIDCEYRVITKSGDIRWVQCRGRVTERNSDGTPIAIGGTVSDITEAREAREALKNAHADLQKAYCVQREFLNCVTHEIRTPLIVVKGYVDMLLEGFAGPVNEKQQSYLQKIQTSSDALLSGLTGMLEMSRIKSGKVEVSYEIFAPVKLVSRVVSTMIPHAHQKGLEMEVQDCGCPCAGVTDATKVTVILTNLLANAIKFTDKGKIQVFVDSDDSGFSVAVVDTGKGISDADVGLIFEEFEQLKTSAKYKETGFGVGLALVASLVNILGAELCVSSAKGVGSAFTLCVPKLDPSAAAELVCEQA